MHSTERSKTPPVLVVFHSRSGRSRAVAEAIAECLGATIEEIDARGAFQGFGSYFRGIAASVRGEATPIVEPRRDPAEFDLVVFVGPLWAGRISCPTRGYLVRMVGRVGRFAAFITSTEGRPTRAFAELSSMIGRPPLATGAITIREHLAGKLPERIDAFVQTIKANLVQSIPSGGSK